jgi:hypothetical protein
VGAGNALRTMTREQWIALCLDVGSLEEDEAGARWDELHAQFGDSPGPDWIAINREIAA